MEKIRQKVGQQPNSNSRSMFYINSSRNFNENNNNLKEEFIYGDDWSSTDDEDDENAEKDSNG